MLDKIIAMLFPNGIGTRATIALMIIGGYIGGVLAGVPGAADLKEFVLIVVPFYFLDRAKQRNGAATP